MSHNGVTLPPYHKHKKRSITNPTDIEALNNLDDLTSAARFGKSTARKWHIPSLFILSQGYKIILLTRSTVTLHKSCWYRCQYRDETCKAARCWERGGFQRSRWTVMSYFGEPALGKVENPTQCGHKMSYKFLMAVISIPEVESLPQTVDVVAQGTPEPYARRKMVSSALRALVCARKWAEICEIQGTYIGLVRATQSNLEVSTELYWPFDMFTLKDEIPDHTLIMIIIVVPIIILLLFIVVSSKCSLYNNSIMMFGNAGLLLINFFFFPDYCRASCVKFCCWHDVTSIKVASKRKWNGIIILIIITVFLSSFKLIMFEKPN